MVTKTRSLFALLAVIQICIGCIVVGPGGVSMPGLHIGSGGVSMPGMHIGSGGVSLPGMHIGSGTHGNGISGEGVHIGSGPEGSGVFIKRPDGSSTRIGSENGGHSGIIHTYPDGSKRVIDNDENGNERVRDFPAPDSTAKVDSTDTVPQKI